MPEKSVTSYSDTCQKLASYINDLSVRIRVSEQNRKIWEDYQTRVTNYTNSVQALDKVINTMKPVLEDTQKFADKRREEAMQSINNALRLAGEIIPDSTEGIRFQWDGDEAWLTTPSNLDVDDVEGGGYRQISSTFVRSVILGAIPNTLKTMLLDEMFALVSPENSATLSLYLSVITQNMQVISIEQKPQVYSNIDCKVYSFVGGDKYATVYADEVKRASNDS